MNEKTFMRYALILMIMGFLFLLLLLKIIPPKELIKEQIPKDSLITFTGQIQSVRETRSGSMLSIQRICTDEFFIRNNNLSYSAFAKLEIVAKNSGDFLEIISIKSL